MKLNPIVALVVIVASTWTSIPVCAEEREGVLTPRMVIPARPIECCLLSPIRGAELSHMSIRLVHAPAPATRQLVHVPVPGTPFHGYRPSLKELGWAAIGIATFAGIVALMVPHD